MHPLKAIYTSPDGWYCITAGPYWYAVLITGGSVQRKKKAGPIGNYRVNYFDRACEICDERNAAAGYKTPSHIPITARPLNVDE